MGFRNQAALLEAARCGPAIDEYWPGETPINRLKRRVKRLWSADLASISPIDAPALKLDEPVGAGDITWARKGVTLPDRQHAPNSGRR